jgi:hypothetical protein
MVATVATLNRRLAGINRQHRVIWQRVEEEARPAATKRGPLELADELGIALDPWQREALTTTVHDILLLVTRQGGKGEVAALLALDKVLNDPGSTVVVISRADRQAKRLLRRIKKRYRSLGEVPAALTDSQYALELRNGSEILALPGSEETIRGIEAVDLLVIDEAALVPDELFAAIFPMLASTDGRCVAMSSARGKRGWFWREWTSSDLEWLRVKITWEHIPRFKPEWIVRTRRRLGEWMFRQEFGCEFLDTDDQLYATELVMAALSPAVASFGLPMLGGDA